MRGRLLSTVWLLLIAVTAAPAQTRPRDGESDGELVVCGWDEVFILDFDDLDGDGRPMKVWSWKGAESDDLPEAFRPLFRSTDECKPVDGGRKILITSSSGGVALVERASGRVLFHARAANAHSAELLPNDCIAVAASHRGDEGDRLLLYDVRRSGVVVWEDELSWGHGVVWDADRKRLWALSGDDLRAYSLVDWDAATPKLKREFAVKLPDTGGHDLSPVPGKADLVVTTNKRVWLFDRDRREFRPHTDLAELPGVKGVAYHPVSGRVAYVQSEGGNWWTERLRFLHPAGELHMPGEHFYKARWNAPRE